MAPDKSIQFPQPHLGAASTQNAVQAGENIVLYLGNQEKIMGKLLDFDFEAGTVHFIAGGQARALELTRVKILHLPKIRIWVRAAMAEGGENADALTLPSIQQDFSLNFKDSDRLQGQTLGFNSNRHGLFFFPAQGNDQYICSFVPHDAIQNYQIGPRIGEVLVDENMVEQAQINPLIDAQQQERSKPLGEYFRTKAIITSMELEQAIQRQKSAPNMRLGEILLSENLITEEQLQLALETQKQNRQIPLGEILAKQGLVDKDQIQWALAKKLSIPFVDLDKFQIDADAVKLIPEDLVRKYQILPLYLYEQKLVVAMENPMDWTALDVIRFQTKLQVEPATASAENIRRAIERGYLTGGFFEELSHIPDEEDQQDDHNLDTGTISDNAVVKLVNRLIMEAYHRRASDIHIEPFPGKQKTRVRVRCDGEMLMHYEISPNMRNAVVARIKIMAGLDISERRKPQDGKIDFKKFAGLPIELRVATLPTTGGLEDVVMRILVTGKPIPLQDLGLSKRNEANLLDLAEKPYGFILVCGPTGSGKTTTLHSVLKNLNTSQREIWTAEDPVEITQPGLRQVQVNSKINLTFANALRAFLRADPDVIMIGEMRDEETAKTGIEASLTGHLVLSTLHTNSAPESIIRLLDIGMDPFNFADALLGVLAQRLTRRLCQSCKQPHTASQQEIDDLLNEYCLDLTHHGTGDEYRNMVLQEWQQFADAQGNFVLYDAVGCDECDHSGYQGRMGLHGLLIATTAIKRAMVERMPVARLTILALEEGMRTLKQDGIEKVLQGLTDMHQVRKVCIK